jgi:hypothetical protein
MGPSKESVVPTCQNSIRSNSPAGVERHFQSLQQQQQHHHHHHMDSKPRREVEPPTRSSPSGPVPAAPWETPRKDYRNHGPLLPPRRIAVATLTAVAAARHIRTDCPYRFLPLAAVAAVPGHS